MSHNDHIHFGIEPFPPSNLDAFNPDGLIGGPFRGFPNLLTNLLPPSFLEAEAMVVDIVTSVGPVKSQVYQPWLWRDKVDKLFVFDAKKRRAINTERIIWPVADMGWGNIYNVRCHLLGAVPEPDNLVARTWPGYTVTSPTFGVETPQAIHGGDQAFIAPGDFRFNHSSLNPHTYSIHIVLSVKRAAPPLPPKQRRPRHRKTVRAPLAIEGEVDF